MITLVLTEMSLSATMGGLTINSLQIVAKQPWLSTNQDFVNSFLFLLFL